MRIRVLVSLVAMMWLFPFTASAVEYRLRIANLANNAYFHFAENQGDDRDSPFALRGLAPALDQGVLPRGVFVWGRSLVASSPATARSFQAVAVRPLSDTRAEGQWEEIRWEGKAGERTIWIVRGEGVNYQAVVGIGLGAPPGELRHYIPYGAGLAGAKLRATRIGLNFIDFWEGREDLWWRFLAPMLNLAGGIAAVVGENPNAVYADSVYVVIEPPPAPTTFDVVIGWHQRGRGRFNPYFDGPGDRR